MSSNEPDCVVYIATNSVNGKRYIGATDRGMGYRANRHKWNAAAGQKSKFYTAIRKYGFEAFKFTVAAVCSDFFEALKKERELIADLCPEYNLTAGGGGVKGLQFSVASRLKMSSAKKGKRPAWCSGPDARTIQEKIAFKLRGAKKKVPMTKEHILKFTAAGNARRRRPVVSLYDGRFFESVTAAAKAYSLTTGQVTYYCRGNHESRRGVDFKYADEVHGEQRDV
jgi:group I intron endonuclease